MKLSVQTSCILIFCAVIFCNCSKHTGKQIAQAPLPQVQERRLLLNQGQKLQVDNTISATNSVEMMGQSMDVKMDIIMASQLEVKEKRDTAYNISFVTTRIATNMEMMGQTTNYDSDKKDDDNEMAKAMKDKINVPVEMEVNNDGKVINIKKDTTKPVNKEADAMASMMSSMNAGGDERTTAGNIFLVLSKDLKTGDKWSDSVITTEGKTYNDYTIVSTDGDSTKVTLTGKQSIIKSIEAQGMEMTVTLENKLSGEIIVDKKTSVVTRKSVTTEGTGTTEIMGQSVPMTTKGTSTSLVKQL